MWVGVLLAGVLLAGHKPKEPRPAPERSSPPAPAPAPSAASPAPPPAQETATTPELFERLQSLYKSLEYEQVMTLAKVTLARPDLKPEQLLEVQRLQASSMAIVGDPAEAERPFRLLLRARPDYAMPDNTPPKILAVFRKVQSEERALASQLKEVERAKLIGGLKLLGELPDAAQGGRALVFSYRLRDPTGAVDVVRVQYRRQGQKVFSSLALERDAEGAWAGAIPGALTADSTGYQLECYVETLDASGPLLTLFTADKPKLIAMSPGAVEVARFKPVPKGVFWTSAAVTIIGALGSGALGYSLYATQANYNTDAMAAMVDGAALADKARKGDQLATALTASLIGSAVMLVITLVFVPLTNFN
jgi:hypothetical protein